MFLFSVLFFCALSERLSNAADSFKMQEVFSWKQMGYNIQGIKYEKDTDFEKTLGIIHFQDDIEEHEKYFIQYNNVPIGLEVYGTKVFVTVPRRRYGIPSTLNYVDTLSRSPLLKPYPGPGCSTELVSVYRPRVDSCDRLWMVDTGLLEVPDARKQVQAPSIVVFDLKTDKQILRYWLKPTDLVNERTSGGFTSLAVDVDRSSCDDAYAYITDLATQGLVVYSMKKNDSWRIEHPSFKYDESLLNFTVASYTIPWRDGLFSVALGDVEDGNRKAYYHAMVSAQEFSVSTKQFKDRTQLEPKLEGTRGAHPQSGSHAYHSGTRTLLFANVAQDAILCWSVDTPFTPEYVAVVAQDHQKLLYISDLKIVNDEVWVMVNQMPVFVYFVLNKDNPNFFVHKAKVEDLIRGTPCDRSVDERVGTRQHGSGKGGRTLPSGGTCGTQQAKNKHC